MATCSKLSALSLVVVGCAGDFNEGATISLNDAPTYSFEAIGVAGTISAAGSGHSGGAGSSGGRSGTITMRWEAESWPILDKTPTTVTSTLSGSSFSGQLALRTSNPSGVGSFVKFRPSASSSGLAGAPVRVLLRTLVTHTAAQIKLSTSASEGGPWSDFAPVDLYSGTTGQTTFDLGTFTFSTELPYFMVTVVGKNAASLAYGFTLDYLEVRGP